LKFLHHLQQLKLPVPFAAADWLPKNQAAAEFPEDRNAGRIAGTNGPNRR
jgi:hypothetical protein